MGKFEDLIEQARGGDLSALDTLQEEFSSTALRSQAESAAEWQKKYENALPQVRASKVSELTAQLDESLQGIGVSADDFAGVDPETLSLELIQGKAQEKLDQKNAQRLDLAKEAGFDSVEEFNSALETAKGQRDQRKEGMEAITSGVASGSGEPGSGEPATMRDRAKEAFDASKKSGKTDDYAMADAAAAIMAAQSIGGDAE